MEKKFQFSNTKFTPEQSAISHDHSGVPGSHEHHCQHEEHSGHHHPHPPAVKFSKGRWQVVYWIMGIGSLVWFVLRTGTNPKRAAYPCQQAAAATGLGFLAYLAAVVGAVTWFRRVKHVVRPGQLIGVGLVTGLAVLAVLGLQISPASVEAASPNLSGWTSPSAVSNVFAVVNVPVPTYSLDGGHLPTGASENAALQDGGVNALVNLMEERGDYFYRTTSHPTGLFGPEDVVVLKLNDQWGGRNSTNTDVVKGVIYQLVKHPQGFSGAVVIAENAQGSNSDWDNEAKNNSQFLNQSYLEVAQAFSGLGYRVCISKWDNFRTSFVTDYDTGSSSDGYVLDPLDSRLSYPKFQVNCSGTNLQISMRKGLWNGSSFDNTRLKMINLPVLKRHGSSLTTAALKNYIGFITTYDPTGTRFANGPATHCWLIGAWPGTTCAAESTAYGLVARQMALIRRADLDLVDATWINPCNNAGWEERAQRQNVLLASRDPFAADYYASEYVLGPVIQQVGSQCGVADYTQSLASKTNGAMRNFMLRNVSRLRALGVTNTINIADTLTRQQELDQFNVYVRDASAQFLQTATPTPAGLASATPLPPTATRTNTSLPPTATRTNTPLPASATPLPPTATQTSTSLPASATPLPPTATRTSTPLMASATPLPPTATRTSTSLPASATPLPPTATRTSTSLPASATPLPPTATRTSTSLPASATPLPPTATRTNTSLPPTATRTSTSLPASATPLSGTFTREYAVSASADDSYEDGTTFSGNSRTVFFGTGAAVASSWTGLRFLAVDIPARAVIQSASIRVMSSATAWNSIQFELFGEASNSCQTFSSASRPSARLLSTAKLTYASNTQWTSGQWYSFDSLGVILQEAVNRPGWQSGGSVCILMKGLGSAWGRKFSYSFDGSPAGAPRLVITYRLP